MEQPRPTHIGRYEVMDRLGAGGMGVVYLATDPLLRRTVAIKVLPAHDDDLRERFAREARSAASLKHNHVVTIYDIGEDDGKPFIAMEFLDGESMAEMVRRRAPLSVDRRLQLLLELCSGLGYAHKHGIIHRDIKPGNLMVTAEGALKILDFGLARITSDVTSTGLTLAGSVMGTPHYMSPEQVEGKVVDPRSDIFSVGVVFYELLSYRKAYPGESAHVILHNIVHATPTPIRDLIPSIDPDLEAIVHKGLEKDPAKRYQTLSSLAAEVTRVRAKFAAATDITTQIALPPGSGGRRTREKSSKATETSPGRGTRHLASLDAIAQRRASQVDAHLKLAAEHFAAGRYQETIDSCENAVLLDSGEERALQLLAQAQGKLEDGQVQQCLEQARACLSAGDLTAAESLIEQSLKLRADSTEAHQLQRAIKEQRRERERVAERARSAQAAADRARRSLDDGAYEAAMRSASEALAYDPAHREALNIRQRASQLIEERQRRQEHDQRALEVADQARNRALADDAKGALALLEGFRPPHPVVDRALAELKAQLAELERRRREEERQRQEEEQRQRQLALENERRRNRSQAHKAAARESLKNARFAEALTSVEAARNEFADDPELDELSKAIYSAKEAADAAARTRELVSRSVQASRVALERGELSAAAEALKTGLEIAPKDPELRALGSSIRVAQQQLDANAAIAKARQSAAAGDLDTGLSALEAFTPRTLVAEALTELKAERQRLQQARELEARRIEERRRAEEEARRRTEEEAQRRTEEEARRRTEEEARRRTEEEARRRTEEEARRRTEEEARRRTEEEAQRRAEEEAQRRAEEDRRARDEATQLVEVHPRRGAPKNVPAAIPEESTQVHRVVTDRAVVSDPARLDETIAAPVLPTLVERKPAPKPDRVAPAFVPPPSVEPVPAPTGLAAVKPTWLAVAASVILIGGIGMWLLTRGPSTPDDPAPPNPIAAKDYQPTLKAAQEKYRALDIEGAVKDALSIPDTATERAAALQLLATMRREAADRAAAERQTAQSTPPLDEEVMQQGARKMEEAAKLDQPADTARVVALHEEAIAFFRKAPTTEWSADRLVREAQKAQAARNRGTAVQLALQALERTPNYPGAVELLRSIRAAAATDTANAGRRARTAGMTDANSPGFRDARTKEAEARKIQNPADTPKALSLFADATAAYASASIEKPAPADPDPPPPPPNIASIVQGHLRRAEERLKAGDLAGANAALREAEKLDPSDSRLAELKKLADGRDSPPPNVNRADIDRVLADAARLSNDADAVKLLTEQLGKYPGNAEIAGALAARTRARDLRITDLVTRARTATDERAVEFLDAALAFNPARTDVREERERRFRAVARVQAERGVRDVLGKYEAAFENRSVAQFLNVASYRTATQIEDEFKSYRSIRMDINAVSIAVQPDGSASVTCTIRTVREPAGIRVKPITDERTWQLKVAAAGGTWRITEATPAK